MNSTQILKIYIERKLSVGTATFYFSGNRSGIDSANAYTDDGVLQTGSVEITLNSDQTICGKFSGSVKPSTGSNYRRNSK